MCIFLVVYEFQVCVISSQYITRKNIFDMTEVNLHFALISDLVARGFQLIVLSEVKSQCYQRFNRQNNISFTSTLFAFISAIKLWILYQITNLSNNSLHKHFVHSIYRITPNMFGIKNNVCLALKTSKNDINGKLK